MYITYCQMVQEKHLLTPSALFFTFFNFTVHHIKLLSYYYPLSFEDSFLIPSTGPSGKTEAWIDTAFAFPEPIPRMFGIVREKSLYHIDLYGLNPDWTHNTMPL